MFRNIFQKISGLYLGLLIFFMNVFVTRFIFETISNQDLSPYLLSDNRLKSFPYFSHCSDETRKYTFTITCLAPCLLSHQERIDLFN